MWDSWISEETRSKPGNMKMFSDLDDGQTISAWFIFIKSLCGFCFDIFVWFAADIRDLCYTFNGFGALFKLIALYQIWEQTVPVQNIKTHSIQTKLPPKSPTLSKYWYCFSDVRIWMLFMLRVFAESEWNKLSCSSCRRMTWNWFCFILKSFLLPDL